MVAALNGALQLLVIVRLSSKDRGMPALWLGV
jgi:hypothetical protein